VKIRRVEYAGTVATPEGPRPGDLPQIAFSGRSNVGKSSLINTLLQRTRSKIAHVSTTPGKTQALNFYRVNDLFFLVDLPGFGYARVPAALREQWKRLIEGYLSREPALKGVVHLVDARHGPMKSDLQMLDYLGTLGVPVLVVLTKVDKLRAREREKALARATAELSVDPDQIVPFSSRTGEGREALLDALAALLELEEERQENGGDGER
jgi:GTP-binding protein